MVFHYTSFSDNENILFIEGGKKTFGKVPSGTLLIS